MGLINIVSNVVEDSIPQNRHMLPLTLQGCGLTEGRDNILHGASANIQEIFPAGDILALASMTEKSANNKGHNHELSVL